MAEFERAFIRERQREGIAIAKAKGKYKGRKRALSAEQLEEISRRIARESVSRIAEEYGVSRQTIYRSLRQNGEGGMRSVWDSRKGCTGLRHESLWHGRERRTHT